MRAWLRRAAIAGGGLLTGLVVVVSGIVPIAASSGHWKVTELALHFTMRRSVATHSLGAPEPPPLDDPRLVVVGAGHYETACRPCHGAPDSPMPEVARHMTPHPPWLPDSIESFDDAELFYVIRHGIKFTGMPAWPADRPDEVWATVAFVRKLPGLDRAGYRAWVFGEPIPETTEVPAVVEATCARCHGADGLGRGGAFPRLAGQRPAYLLASLEAYARGDRHSGIMQPVAVALDEEAMRAAVEWYAARPSRPHAHPEDTRGALIARGGIPERGVPGCVHCHGPWEALHPAYPLLDGQPVAYLEQQLDLFEREARGGTAYGAIMREVAAHALREDEIGAVSRFYGVP